MRNEDRVAKGFFFLTSPLWVPFWLLGWAWEQIEELFSHGK
jgi:hypothetical protein